MGENQIDWIANEGVRISQILKHLQGLSLPEGQAKLRKQLLDSEKGWQAGTSASRELAMTGLETESAGNLWTLPLQLTIDVGHAVSGVGVSAVATPPAEADRAPPAPTNGAVTGQPNGEKELASAFAALERSAPAVAASPPPESAVEWLVGGNNGAGPSWP
jgi:endonuclease G